MGYIKLPGGIYAPEFVFLNVAFSFTSGMLIDATGEKAAFMGQVVWNDSTTSKDITKVGIRFGAVTKAGGSGLTLSLQDVSLTAGTPMQPDETQDQTYAIANGNASFASNTWLHSGALSTNRTVNFGDLVGVVLEYDGGGRLGADSVVLAGLTTNSSQPGSLLGAALKTGGSWAVGTTVSPDIIFEFTDGTFGTFAQSVPASAINSHSFNNTSSPDEYALKWQLPFHGKIDGGWLAINANTTADYSIRLYDSDGTTLLASRACDGNTGAGAMRFTEFRFSTEVAFKANTNYYLALRPDSTTNNGLQYIDMADAAYMGALFGGTNWVQSSRTDAGSWTDLATRRILGGVHVSSVGIPPTLPTGFAGGMRG